MENADLMEKQNMLSKKSTYVKSYDGQTKLIYFLIEDDDLWEK